MLFLGADLFPAGAKSWYSDGRDLLLTLYLHGHPTSSARAGSLLGQRGTDRATVVHWSRSVIALLHANTTVHLG